MRIGIVDLDTSHPENWIPIEREMGHQVVGVFDGGSIHPKGYAEQFAAKHDVPVVFAAVEEMVDAVDCAIIHGCDWDTHVQKARPFIEAGKAVLIDKPLAGNLRDLHTIRDWARGGARVAGGSALRYCRETRDWLAIPAAERGTPDTVLCGCAVDEFNYGIHAYSMLAGILGTGARSVRNLGQGVQRRVQVKWDDGRCGLLVIGKAAGWIPFYASISTQKSCAQYVADNSRLYRALLEVALPYLAGEAEQPPASPDHLIEPEMWALAARQSWNNGDREVALAHLDADDPGYDGAAFAAEYRAAKYPAG